MNEEIGTQHLEQDPPMVTFAIFGYNQERFIREAVAAAFDQTYEPMEVIMSDDCSTDRTFEIMREMATTYKGPKAIIVRQTKRNSGTLLHVADVASVAKGRLVILAAGDDISKSNRTERLVSEWLSTNAWGLCSQCDRIDEHGNVISYQQELAILSSRSYRLRQYLLEDQRTFRIIHGATSAYDRRVFDFLTLAPTDYILSEDGVLSVLLYLLKEDIHFVRESLVSYRESDQSLTNASKKRRVTFRTIVNDESAIERFARSQANRCRLFLRFHKKFENSSNSRLNVAYIEGDLKKHRVRADWRSLGILRKIEFIVENFSYADLRWALPRVLPMPLFFLLKAFISKARRGW